LVFFLPRTDNKNEGKLTSKQLIYMYNTGIYIYSTTIKILTIEMIKEFEQKILSSES
jgi:hypothetical protein